MSSAPQPSGSSRSVDTHADGPSAGIEWMNCLVPAAFGLLTFLMCIFPMRDTDFYWHVRTGELIWQNMAIPSIDLYTYTDFDKRWIDLHWGYQLLVAAVYHLGGVNGTILFKAACYTLAVMLGWYATGKRVSNWFKALIWFPSLIAISGRAYERPEMISLICLAATLWLLERIPKNPRLIWVVPGLLIVWTNFHALFVLGVVVCGAFVAGGLGLNLLARRSGFLADAQLPTKSLIVLGSLALAAPIINPYLEEGWLFPVELYRKFSVEHDFYSPRVGEFMQPKAFLDQTLAKRKLQGKSNGIEMLFAGEGMIFPFAEMAIFVIAVAAGAYLLVKKRRVSLYRTLLLIGFSHLAWVAVRNTSIFALVGAVASCGLHDDASDEKDRRGLSHHIDQIAAILMGVFMVVVVTGGWGAISESWKTFGWNEAPNWFGHEAMKFAAQPGMPKRAYLAHFGLAGTYIMHNGPENKVFMDPRLEVCSRKTFEQWELAMSLMANRNPAWEGIVNPDGKGLPAVILDSRSSRPIINGLLMTPTWRLVFADPSAAVFIPASLADELKLPMADPRPLHKPD